MLALLVAATLAQSSSPALRLGLFHRPGPGSLAPTLRESVLASVASSLDEAGFTVFLDAHEVDRRLRRADAERCSSGAECLYRIARMLEVDVLVAVEATEFEGDVAVALEAVAADRERPLARQSTVVRSAEIGRTLPTQLDLFIRELRGSLAPKLTDAPVAVKKPDVTPHLAQMDLTERAPPLQRSRVPSLLAAGGGAVAGGAAIVFSVTGLVWSAKVCQRETVDCPNTYPQTKGYADAANQNLTLALVSAGVSATLTTVAALLWPKEKE
jgi:hypothetical protein